MNIVDVTGLRCVKLARVHANAVDSLPGPIEPMGKIRIVGDAEIPTKIPTHALLAAPGNIGWNLPLVVAFRQIFVPAGRKNVSDLVSVRQARRILNHAIVEERASHFHLSRHSRNVRNAKVAVRTAVTQRYEHLEIEGAFGAALQSLLSYG